MDRDSSPSRTPLPSDASNTPRGGTSDTAMPNEQLTTIQNLNERERELHRRTEALETLVRNLTISINNMSQNMSHMQVSTPIRPLNHPDLSSPYNLSALRADTQPNQEMPAAQSSASSPPVFNLTSPDYSKISLREALETVPKFDGHNIPVLQFARACKRAKELIPFANESHLVRLLRNKLTGHAYLAVEDEEHNTIDKFTDSLKRTFGPSRT